MEYITALKDKNGIHDIIYKANKARKSLISKIAKADMDKMQKDDRKWNEFLGSLSEGETYALYLIGFKRTPESVLADEKLAGIKTEAD